MLPEKGVGTKIPLLMLNSQTQRQLSEQTGDVHLKEALRACFDSMSESEEYLLCANLCHCSWLAFRL